MTTVEKISKQEDIVNLLKKSSYTLSLSFISTKIGLGFAKTRELVDDLINQGHLVIVGLDNVIMTDKGRKAWSKTFGSIPKGFGSRFMNA